MPYKRLNKLIILFATGIILPFVIMGLTGCEGYSCAHGIVKDKMSNTPVDSVFIKVVSGSRALFTDTTGMFDVCNNMGSCVGGCKDIIVEFSKNGYKTQTLHNPDPGVIVLLDRQ